MNLGKLTEVLETGANNVYEVTTPDGKTVLIPVIDQCILAHDMKEKTVTVHLLPGLLDMKLALYKKCLHFYLEYARLN